MTNSLSIPQQDTPDTLDFWAEAYFHLEASAQKKSVKEQRRNISLFLDFMGREEGGLERIKMGTPTFLGLYWQSTNKLRPFPLGNPMEKIHALPVSSKLET